MTATTNTRIRTNEQALHIRIFIVNELEKWLEQNKAECVEVIEGCLIDNALYACKRGYAAIYERVVNSGTSAYETHFQPYSDNDGMDVYNEFYEYFEDDLKDLED